MFATGTGLPWALTTAGALDGATTDVGVPPGAVAPLSLEQPAANMTQIGTIDLQSRYQRIADLRMERADRQARRACLTGTWHTTDLHERHPNADACKQCDSAVADQYP